MEKSPEQTATRSALDRVATALQELGQETAAVIAQRADVGYSTATKRLRALEDAGQAEPFRAGDGRTLWRRSTHPATTTGSDDAPDSTVDTSNGPPSAPVDADASGPAKPHESPVSEQEADAAAAVGPDGEAPDRQPDDAAPTTPDSDPEPAAPPVVAREADQVPGEPITTGAEQECDEAIPAGVEEPGAVGSGGEAVAGQSPDPVGSVDPTAASGPAEAAGASSDGRPRRSKGSLRGAIRDVLEAHPDRSFKTSELCKAIDTANEGSGSAKASAGAVVNAVHKLVADGVAVQVAERPATFQLAATSD